MIKVNEHFLSIQGESENVGIPSYFIRVSGCFMRCFGYGDNICDSAYTWNSEKGDIDLDDTASRNEFEKILDKYKKYDIVCTGGEPAMFFDNMNFINFIKRQLNIGIDRYVNFETIMIPNLKYFKQFSIDALLNNFLNNFTEHSLHENLRLVISPKINPDCYINKQSRTRVGFNDILRYYRLSYESYFKYKNHISFKIVYDPAAEDFINIFIENLPQELVKNNLTIMSLTPTRFTREKHIESCKRTVDYCLKNNYRYSPRVQVDIWDTLRGK